MNHLAHGGAVHPLAPRFATQDPVLGLSALEQAARIADGTLTSIELVERYLARITRHDPALSAFATVLADTARRDAERADRMRARGTLVGKFHGVPTAIKDHHLVRFTRTRIGSRAFDWLWTPVDDDFVKGIRAGGFVLIGKTTMSELGILPVVETALQQPTRNPWNTSRTAGGSSGGAGAAIAAGLLPIAPGSDGAGSVRIPSSLNGLVGLKPTRGLVPDRSNRIDAYGLASNGPMARSLDDAAALLDVMAAPGRRDHLARSRDPVRPQRIAMILDAPVGDVDPRIAAIVERAAERLRAQGHTVERRPCPSATLDDFLPVYQRFVSRIPLLAPKRLGEFARWFWETGRTVPESRADALMRGFEAVGRATMEGFDVLLTPTVGILPFEVGEHAHLAPPEHFRALAPLGAFTALANVTGQPALSVPFGTVEGMPVGVQLLGRDGQDAMLFALARALAP
jgi:amidase